MRSVSHWGRFQEFVRVFFEFRQTVLAAEVISLPLVGATSSRLLRLYNHAADWISHIGSSSTAGIGGGCDVSCWFMD
jgi:hypothetical protein